MQGRDEEAIALTQSSLMNEAYNTGFVYLNGQDLVDFEQVFKDGQDYNNENRKKNRESIDKGFINYDELDYGVAVQDAEGYSLDYNEDAPEFANLTNKQKSKAVYDIAYDKYKEINSILKKRGIAQGGAASNTFERWGAGIHNNVLPFGSQEQKDIVTLMDKKQELVDYLKKYAPMQVRNVNPFELSEGFAEGTATGLNTGVNAFVEGLGELVGMPNTDKNELEFAREFTQEHQETTSALQGEGQEMIENYFDTERKGGQTVFKKKSDLISNPYELGEAGGQTAVLAVELYLAKRLNTSFLSGFSKGEKVSKFMNMPLVEKAKYINEAEKISTYGKMFNKAPSVVNHLTNAVDYGLTQQTAGLVFNKTDELNFGTGFVSYIGAALGTKARPLSRLVSFFGKGKGSAGVYNGVAQYGKSYSRPT